MKKGVIPQTFNLDDMVLRLASQGLDPSVLTRIITVG